MPILRLGRRWLWDQWMILEEEAEFLRAQGRRRGLDFRPLVILLVVCLSLTMQEYWGERDFFHRHFPPGREPGGINPYWWELASFGWWTGWRVFGYLVLPMAVIACMPGERIRDYGLSLRGFARHAWIYVALYLAILPLVVAASYTEAFQKTYPFYKLASRSTFDLVAWELMYAAQFLSLEFFFRGFMLQGLKPALGPHAIWVMCVPYCMIHFGKPMAETVGAIFAGIVLGTLAMRTRSIWLGVLIHVSVALTMDFLSLHHQR